MEIINAQRFVLAVVTTETDIVRQEIVMDRTHVEVRIEVAPELRAFLGAFQVPQQPRLFGSDVGNRREDGQLPSSS